MSLVRKIVSNNKRQEYGELQRRRDEILRDIDAHKNSNSEHTLSLLSKLEGNYNLVVSTIRKLEISPLEDPFSRLPEEILIQIFKNPLSVNESSSKLRHAQGHLDRLLVCTLVCQQWRDRMLAIPALWSTVYVTDSEKEEDMEAKLQTFLSISRPYRLDVTVFINARESDTIARRLAGHTDRIRTLKIVDLHQGYTYLTMAWISRILSTIGLLPNLERLRVEAQTPIGGEDATRVFQQAPSLTNFHGMWLRATLPPQRALQSLALDLSPYQVWDIAESYPRLEEFRVRLTKPVSTCGSTELRTEYKGPAWFFLRFLAMEIHTTGINHVFSTFTSRTPVLFNLRVILTQWEALPSILMILEASPRLAYFMLKLKVSSGTPPPLPRIGQTSIKTLHLTWSGADMDIVFDALLGKTPYVRHLKLYAGKDAQFPSPFVHHLGQVEEINLNFHQRGLKVNLQSDTLLRLDISAFAFFSKAGDAALDCRNLRALTLINNTPISFRPRHSFECIGTKNCVSLQELSFLGTWRFEPFPSLNVRSVTCPPNQKFITDLLCYIIYQPHDCPRLEELSLHAHRIPWDLLIVAIERRNTLPHKSNVAQLKQITVLESPSDWTRMLLIRALRGEFVFSDLVSDGSYSIEKICKHYLDHNITGCHNCALAARPCDISVGETVFPIRYPFEVAANAPTPATYGLTLDDARVRWLDRRGSVAGKLSDEWNIWTSRYSRTIVAGHSANSSEPVMFSGDITLD